MLAAVHAADTLSGIIGCGEPESQLDVGYLDTVGVADHLPRWRELVNHVDIVPLTTRIARV